jgi:hypothetical protein
MAIEVLYIQVYVAIQFYRLIGNPGDKNCIGPAVASNGTTEIVDVCTSINF